MQYVSHVRRKFFFLEAQIDLLLAGDFPYENPKYALNHLREALYDRLAALNSAQDDDDYEEIKTACQEINAKIVEYHPILGFLLRATNLRNAFEIHDPLQRLTSDLLDEHTLLILSSEWAFSPFTYPYISDDLPQYVFVGFPVSEAGNALILPLAGHELGHSVWRRAGARESLRYEINEAVFEQFCLEENRNKFGDLREQQFDPIELLDDRHQMSGIYRSACAYAVRQCEEIYCDTIAIRIFGSAFIDAFNYLISPGLGGARSPLYPPVRERLAYMKLALRDCSRKRFSFEDIVVDELPYQTRGDNEFVLFMADKAVQSCSKAVIGSAIKYCDQKAIPKISYSRVKNYAALMKTSEPVEGAGGIGEIVCAGWEIFLSIGQEGVEGTGMNVEILNHLLYKSFEVFEYEYRVKK